MYMIKVAKIKSHQPVQHALCTTLLGMAVFHIVHGLLVWVSCNGFHLFLPLFLRNLRRRTPDATLLHAFRRCSFLNTLSTVLCSICEIKGWEFLVPIISPPWTKKKTNNNSRACLRCGWNSSEDKERESEAIYAPDFLYISSSKWRRKITQTLWKMLRWLFSTLSIH